MNIAIVHTRLKCLDGVSVEADKWAKVYKSLNHNVFHIAGKICGKSLAKSLEIPELYHFDPKINKLRTEACRKKLSEEKKKKIIKKIFYYSNIIKPKIKKFLKKKKISLLSVENIFSLATNISFTIAVVDIIKELNLPCIARHHDFYWEREEYLRYEANFKEIFDEYFPPKIKNIIHVVISKAARDSLYKRKGIRTRVVYNKFDFSDVKKEKRKKNNLRKEFHIGRDDIIFLQPTKMIRRKNIERSIELVSKFERKKKKKGKSVLVITGVADFSKRYSRELRSLAEKMNVKMLPIHKDLNPEEKKNARVHSISDIYLPSDVVMLPSDHEGFGNPVIESAMFKKPLVVNRYRVLNELLDYGFKFILMNKKVSDRVVNDVYKVIVNRDLQKKINEHNFKIARKYFSLNSLKDELRLLINKASR